MSETNGQQQANSKEKRQFVIYSKDDIHVYVDTHQPDHDIKSAQLKSDGFVMQDVYILAHSGQEALEKFEHKTSLIRIAYIMWVVFLLALIATDYQDLAAALITCTALIHALAASSK